MRPILAKKSGHTFLPDQFRLGHELCFLTHDALAELLRSAEQQGVFTHHVRFENEDDRREFERAADVFDWFEATGRSAERAKFFRKSVFPALRSDMLHFVYEALESSRKAKLAVTYALLRKPIQETLFVLEVIAYDLPAFAERFLNDPLQLRGQKAGGVEAHHRRIAAVLEALGENHRFDAKYLAQLRYDKSSDDGFDGVCNLATHLFTQHKAIQTDKMNINFIFSDWPAKMSQWSFLYSRLPYLLAYARSLTEHVFASFQPSDPRPLSDTDRRLSAGTLLWADSVSDDYRSEALSRFVSVTREGLYE